MARQEELTRFLKSARARINPRDVGLPSGERRRAEGLRREEVATLSGMSVTWYTWFEQGRKVQLSASMLERLSQALKLDRQEREFLFALAQHRPPPLKLPPDDVISDVTQELIDSMSIPAQVITEEWTVIGWNALVARVFRDYGALEPKDRNLFRILLLSERYRADRDEYRAIVKRLTARLRWDYSRTTRVAEFDALIEDMLGRCEIFRECWEATEIVAYFQGVQTVNVPGIGDINLRHSSYAIEEAPSQRLMLFAPVDPLSVARLDEIKRSLRPELSAACRPQRLLK